MLEYRMDRGNLEPEKNATKAGRTETNAEQRTRNRGQSIARVAAENVCRCRVPREGSKPAGQRGKVGSGLHTVQGRGERTRASAHAVARLSNANVGETASLVLRVCSLTASTRRRRRREPRLRARENRDRWTKMSSPSSLYHGVWQCGRIGSCGLFGSARQWSS